MAKTLAERQMEFRTNRKADGGMRLDMWLPAKDAEKLRKLMVWNAKTGPQTILELINRVWEVEAHIAAEKGHADAQFVWACECAREYASGRGTTRDKYEAQKWFSKCAEQG